LGTKRGNEEPVVVSGGFLLQEEEGVNVIDNAYERVRQRRFFEKTNRWEKNLREMGLDCTGGKRGILQGKGKRRLASRGTQPMDGLHEERARIV